MEDRDGAPDLVWLPPVMPENVRLIVSTLPGRALDEINKRRWPVLHVQGLDQVSGNSEVEGITSYSYVDRYTPPGVLGLVKGWDNPAWIDSSPSTLDRFRRCRGA